MILFPLSFKQQYTSRVFPEYTDVIMHEVSKQGVFVILNSKWKNSFSGSRTPKEKSPLQKIAILELVLRTRMLLESSDTLLITHFWLSFSHLFLLRQRHMFFQSRLRQDFMWVIQHLPGDTSSTIHSWLRFYYQIFQSTRESFQNVSLVLGARHLLEILWTRQKTQPREGKQVRFIFQQFNDNNKWGIGG